MTRRMFTVASVMSLALFLAAMVLWVRSTSRADVWEVLTHNRDEWQFGSSPRAWTITHVDGWPEQPGVRHASYVYADPRELKEHSLAVHTGIAPGTFVREARFLGVSLQHGKLSTLVGRGGIVIRIPPSPPGGVLQYLSAPMSFWSLSFPGWLVPALFLLLPCGVLVPRVRTWIRAHVRGNRMLCERCGYDLRATPDRCPECGTPGRNKGNAGVSVYRRARQKCGDVGG